VLFVQEAGFDGWEKFRPQGYELHKSQDSMIIYRNFVFKPDTNKEFEETFGKKLNFNDDSTHLLVKSYLLVSTHLTSKAHNVKQAA
jgi:hypothetical protein